MENFYEELYQYLIERGIDEDEATEVVNYLYEDNIHEYGLITENKGKAFLNILRTVGYMSGVLKKPGAKKAVKQVVKQVQGTPLQGNLLTKSGKAQNFTGGRTPFTGTSPVPAASSKLPQPKANPVQTPGQMRIPGMSDKAQDLRNITRNPNLGLPGNTKGFAVSGGRASQRSMPTLKAQPQRVAPSLPKPAKADSVVGAVKKVKKAMTALGTAGVVTGGVGLTGAVVDKANKDSAARRLERDQQKSEKLAQQRSEKLAQQKAETQAASQPKPEPTGERSAQVNKEKQEIAKADAENRRNSAADFDKTFAAARKAGKKEFTWRGRRYNTKLKGE
jgi:hypothetical protein|tara:strand:+ start:257 stop:1258 length:1002 start_codon:yes stop_codon:yes gene_type:complete